MLQYSRLYTPKYSAKEGFCMQFKDKLNIPLGKLHEGHRQRLIEKLDTQTLQPHEYLEALLFAVEPRRDTNATAHRLLFAFGSPYGVFNASYESLLRVEGVGKKTATFLSAVGGLVCNLYETEESVFPTSYAHETFLSFIKCEYEKETEEVADIYFLTEDGYIFYRERLCVGTSHSIEYTGTALQEAIVAETPYAVILIHTHPKSNAKPSETDIKTTENFARICQTLGAEFVEHFIYSPQGIYSFYQSGLLCKIIEKIIE